MEIFSLASFIGTTAFAVSGFAIGVRKHLDLLGLLIAATLTALGGGIIRDILVGQTPRALVETLPVVTVVGSITLAWMLRLHRRPDIEKRILYVVSDSVGLIAFSITGALIGLEAQLSFFGVLLLAFVTAVGGGLLRDILLNELPLILSSEFYGSVAILVAAGAWGLDAAGAFSPLALALLFGAGLALRLVAYFREWHLPKI